MAKKKQEDVKKVVLQRKRSEIKLKHKVIHKENALKNKEIQQEMMKKKLAGYKKTQDGTFAKILD